MNRALAAALLGGASFALVACGNAEPAAYGTPGGPLVAPTDPAASEAAGSTLNRQQNSGYYAAPGNPDVTPLGTQQPGAAASTPQRQQNGGYYPYAGAPDTLVPPSRR